GATGANSLAAGVGASSTASQAVAVGNNAVASGNQALALGAGATANQAGSVALGSGSATATAVATPGATIAGTAYTFAGTAPTSTVSVGAAGAERTITNVAAGRVSDTSTDAINGSQLFATNSAVDNVANQVTNITGQLTHYYSVNDGGTQGANYGNDGATGTNSLAAGVGASSTAAQAVAVGAGATASEAGSVALGSGSVTAAAVATPSTTINGTAYAFAGTAPASTVSVGAVGAERTITNVAAGRVSNTSTDAINGSQLFATNQAVETLGSGWTVSANGTNATNVGVNSATGNSVDMSNTDGNLVVSKSTTSNDVTFDLADDIAVDSVTAGGTVLNTNGLTIAGGPSVTINGIDAGNRTITNVAAGVNPTDAVNVSQLSTVQGQLTHYYSVNDGGTQGANYANDGATGTNSLAAGVGASAAGAQSIAVGNTATAQAAQGVAIGSGSRVATNGGLALGAGSVSDRTLAPQTGGIISGTGLIPYNTTDKTLLGAVSVGNATSYRQITNVADGTEDQDAVTLRQLKGSLSSFAVTPTMYFHANSTAADSLAVGAESVAIGPRTTVNGDNGIGMGNGAIVQMNAPGGIAIGQDSTVNFADGVALGTNAVSNGIQSMALGAGATANEPGSVALGAGSVTAAAVGTSSVVIGNRTYTFAGTNPTSTISIGGVGTERTLTNVAAGRISG
ncbi:YadA family autotransporter adhesin, partial [[Pseudomonas] boreopolis]|uniref:YadA family autotransporter adhesin n=1 Tax=Xanthomonas boreopolis TaxID=86183 RepID=UPI003D9AD88A